MSTSTPKPHPGQYHIRLTCVELGDEGTADTIAQANEILRGWSEKIPRDGSYFILDVEMWWDAMSEVPDLHMKSLPLYPWTSFQRIDDPFCLRAWIIFRLRWSAKQSWIPRERHPEITTTIRKVAAFP